ncbi:alpha/beta fold hydrolase [Nocardiopsis lambiniae]|uniref:Alpha/beta fold hydrolase n=1 Tax=Nocardiopsis lambiniae TaxID=3075539 RepID=A0ABU2M8E2_9ACTN|nr:alpha/beta fold hydrolase [Nocardiopsis sp. DSM 44743]MDT0328884.1 alpha/beta fold hydrolase [Nocardiopsis sp. DSM 44743]
MRYLARPQGRIAYDLYGADGTGTLVVCVPGMFDHRASFRFVGEALAEAGHRVAVMDLRGQGDSDATFDDHTNRAAADDAIALAEELGGEDVVMVGNSLGGAAVTIAALERPDLVAGIVPMAAFLRSPSPNAVVRIAQRLMLLRPWGPRLLTGFYDGLHRGRKPEGHREQLDRVLAMLRPADRYRAVHATIYAPGDEVLTAEGLRARAVVIGGELDPDWKDPAAEAAWVGSVVGGRVVMVPDCGHYPQSQRPDLVVPVLKELIEEVRAHA